MKVLVTGGSGLVGGRLTTLLQSKNYEVVHLSRRAKETPVKTYAWDLSEKRLDPEAISGVDYIVHLAGSGVADGRWTASRKKEILESRTGTSELLLDTLRNHTHQVRGIVAASAVGSYGMDTGDVLCKEDSPEGTDFLAEVVSKWEKVTSQYRELEIPTAQLRIGVVLDRLGGALAKMEPPVKFGIGSPLGSGKQWMSWIHVDDLCNMIVFSMENGLDDPYNAVAPEPVTNAALTKAMAAQLKKPLFMPNVPSFALKILFGEMSAMILGGNKVSSARIEKAGFTFKYPQLETALADLYK